ncbi:hypothetical protein [Spirosoma sp. KNUC1025]|uniref:hypothetical protein n=1 Tax=Spirosoma sp. KNUC1025 TaxID=2894082 RepID=UPI00386C568E|nr:hypothetical protein LN737_00880 [Spirosoma sp. KNUC1025]
MVSSERSHTLGKTTAERMNALFTPGRILVAIAMVSLGLEHLITGNFPVALLPIPGHFPGRYVMVLTLGIVLITAGMCVGVSWKADYGAFGLGVLFGLLALSLHVPPLLKNPSNGGAWTVFGELLAFSGGSFFAAGLLSQAGSAPSNRRFGLILAGRCLFAGALVIFGVLHFIYAHYIATLMPSWIPAPLFWAYFVGVAFLATAVSLLINWLRTLSTGLLGLMFLLWVVVLHAPRTAKNPQVEPEWTSLFIALAMSGFCFLIASSARSAQTR